MQSEITDREKQKGKETERVRGRRGQVEGGACRGLSLGPGLGRD